MSTFLTLQAFRATLAIEPHSSDSPPQPCGILPRKTPSLSQKNTVQVLDDNLKPISRTTQRNADRYVSHGRARWHGKAVQFIQDDYRVISAAANAKRYRDGAGFATLDAIAALPCIQPVKLITGKRPAKSPKDVPAYSLISRRYLPIEECSVNAPTYRELRPYTQTPRSVRVVMAAGVLVAP